MKKIMKVSLVALLLAGLSFNAQALTITFEGPYVLAGDDTGTPEITAAIEAYLGPSVFPLVEAYKQDTGGAESGPYAGSYSTVFAPPSDPVDATITYTGGPVISSAHQYLLVKDGNQENSTLYSWYLYNLATWNGTDAIELTGFWPQNGSISHVSIYTRGGAVPDGGATAMLLGLAVLGLGGLKRLIRG